MTSLRSFSALSFLLEDDRTVACGTWFLMEGEHLPRRLQGKMRNVVAGRESGDGGVVVYPRSASQRFGLRHPAHSGHECSATEVHDVVGLRFSAHQCHVDKEGWVDTETPILLATSIIEHHRMCFEDDASALIEVLERGLE